MNANTLKNSLPLMLIAALVGGLVVWASTSGPSLVGAGDAREGEVLDGGASQPGPPAGHAPSFVRRAVREPVSVPAGTTLAIALDETLSTETHQAGDAFTGRVASPVTVDGRTVIPAGARVSGELADAARKRIGGRARLVLELTSVSTTAGGRPVSGTYTALGKSQTKRDALTIGGATAGGAILGRTIGHERGDEADGTLIGAAVGGGIGTAVAASNRAPHVVIPAGSTIQVRLTSGLTV